MLAPLCNREMAKFLTVGIVSAVVDFSVLYGVSHFAGPTASFLVAYPTGVATHFVLNKYWTFNCTRTDLGRQALQYAGTVLAAFLVQWAVYTAAGHLLAGNGLLAQAAAGLGLKPDRAEVLVAKACAIPPSTVVCYVLLKLGVFTGQDAEAES